jgi:hypothetical protein
MRGGIQESETTFTTGTHRRGEARDRKGLGSGVKQAQVRKSGAPADIAHSDQARLGISIIKSDTLLRAACSEWYPLKDECQTVWPTLLSTAYSRLRQLALILFRLGRQMLLPTVNVQKTLHTSRSCRALGFVLSCTLVLSFTDSETQPLGVDGAWGVSSGFCVIAPFLGETSGAGEGGRMSGMSRVRCLRHRRELSGGMRRSWGLVGRGLLGVMLSDCSHCNMLVTGLNDEVVEA